MNSLKMYQVDAFASALFKGNPAAVCPLDSWLSDQLMQNIAAENNLSETVFFVPEGEGFHIRWFTPNEEIALCGHATLASAFVIFNHLDFQGEQIRFRSKSGELLVRRSGQELEMNFPALPYHEVPFIAPFRSLNLKEPKQTIQSQFDLMFVYENELDVINAQPDLNAVANIDYRGLILTAPGSHSDIYSRCFYPGCDVPEDPVTGSAHCVLTPYWCEQSGKEKISAIQGGKRQGNLMCALKGDRVLLYGACQLYMEGTIYLP